MRPLRKMLVVGCLVAAVPVAGASLAYACTALATLSFSSTSAAPGATLTGTGKGFNGGGHGTPSGTTPVVLHWQTRTGPVLATTAPSDAAGNIAYSFTVPASAAAGQYVVIAVQTNPATGNPFYGTPSRQALKVTVAGARASGAPETVAAPVASSVEPAAQAAPVANVAAPAQAAPAAPSVAARQAATKASVPQVAPASRSAAAAAAAAPTVVAPSSTPSVAEASTAAAPVAAATVAQVAAETFTPGLILASSDTGSDSSRSVAGAILLVVVGMLLALAATARWLTTRPLSIRPPIPA